MSLRKAGLTAALLSAVAGSCLLATPAMAATAPATAPAAASTSATDPVDCDPAQAFQPLKVTSGHSFPGTPVTTISGTATPGATVEAKVFGVPTMVDVDSTGHWSYKRGFNNALTYSVDFTQRFGDRTDSVSGWKIGPALAEFAPLAVTSGHTFPGTPVTTIRGTATPNATVDAVVFGVKATVPVGADGTWEYKRGFNNALNYTVDFTQHAGDKTDSISGWKIGPAARS